MQQHLPSRAAIALAVLTLGACVPVGPYGPAIPGSGIYPSASARVVPAAAPEAAVVTPAGAPGEATTEEPLVRPVAAPRESAAPAAGEAPAARPLSPLALPSRFRSRQDSLAWIDAWRRAKTDKGLRVVVSLDARSMWLLKGRDTLRYAPVAIGTEKRLVHGKQEWVFETPRGVRRVQGKAANPIWTPPLWHYVEMAERHALKLAVMPPSGRVALPNGERLEVRDSLVGRWTPGRGWTAWPIDDEIVVDGTLYMPPIGTRNRIQHGQLGPFKLDVGQGYLIHGSPDASSIGRAATHGCIRLSDEDLAFVYEQVPVGTPVYIL